MNESSDGMDALMARLHTAGLIDAGSHFHSTGENPSHKMGIRLTPDGAEFLGKLGQAFDSVESMHPNFWDHLSLSIFAVEQGSPLSQKELECLRFLARSISARAQPERPEGNPPSRL